jgi:hypothetical protein
VRATSHPEIKETHMMMRTTVLALVAILGAGSAALAANGLDGDNNPFPSGSDQIYGSGYVLGSGYYAGPYYTTPYRGPVRIRRHWDRYVD